LKMKNRVLILDIHGLINEKKSDSMRRHFKYHSELLRLSKESMHLMVISRLTDREKNPQRNLSTSTLEIQTSRTVNFLSNSLRTVRKCGTGSVLVCGDPWFSYWVGSAVKLLSRRKIPIQVQIHADIYDSLFVRRNLKNFVKLKIAYFAFYNADSIRTVSKRQTQNLIKRHPEFEPKIVKSSVPLNSDFLKSRSKRPPDGYLNIGILGRIENDRGLKKLLSVIEISKKSQTKIRFIIAGSGNFKIKAPIYFEKENQVPTFTFLGEISSQKLPDFFYQIDVLLSLAPTESFGRAIRESLLAGRPVVAIESSGVLELQESVGNNSIHILSQDASTVSIVEALLSASRNSISRNVTRTIQQEQEQSVNALVKSWMNLSSIGSRGSSNDS